MPERGALRRPITALAAAITFLTRLPVSGRAAAGDAELSDAACLFPLVGAAIGALVGGAVTVLDGPLTPLLAATLAVALELALTGALHLDGLADSADGLAGRDQASRLEIMRDDALGTYGASAVVLAVVAKVAALAALADGGVVLPVLAAFAVSRAAPLPLAAALPYARPSAGTGRSLADSLDARRAVLGLVLAVTLAAAAVGWDAAVALGSLVLVVLLVGLYSKRALGGITGDVMGAAIELTVTLALVLAAAS